MNCLWNEVPGTRDDRGWRQLQCQRCSLLLKPTPHPNPKSQCRGLPFAHEWGHWLTLWLGVFGISKAGVDWLARRLRLGDCGCAKREAALNTIGERFAALWKR